MPEEEHEHEHESRVQGGGPRNDCQEALQELYVFLDGELTIEKREHIRVHLDDCNPCLEAYDFEAELRIVISAKCKEVVPQTLKDKILRALEEA